MSQLRWMSGTSLEAARVDEARVADAMELDARRERRDDLVLASGRIEELIYDAPTRALLHDLIDELRVRRYGCSEQAHYPPGSYVEHARTNAAVYEPLLADLRRRLG